MGSMGVVFSWLISVVNDCKVVGYICRQSSGGFVRKREMNNSSMASRGWVENRCDICASFGCDMSLDMSRRKPPEPWMSRPLMSWLGSWMMFIEHFCSLGMSAWRVANMAHEQSIETPDIPTSPKRAQSIQSRWHPACLQRREVFFVS